MGKRRTARESALQILFELEFNDADLDVLLARYWKDKKVDRPTQKYADWLVRGVVLRRADVDGLIQGSSKHWRIPRMPFVDRNILRIAVFELLEEKLVAPAVIINEAIEIAKRYSGDTAAVFVNGVLDAVRKKIETARPKQERIDVNANERTKQTPPKKSARSGGRTKKK
jgi:N utilization substance protein B